MNTLKKKSFMQWRNGAAIACLAACLSGVLWAAERPLVEKMRIVFCRSAVCFTLPDGGSLLIDIGRGSDRQTLALLKKSIMPDAWVYRLYSFFGWQPRIDWLMLVPRDGEWDGGCQNILNAYAVRNIFLPFALPRKSPQEASSLGSGSTDMLVQISLSRANVFDLRRQKAVDLRQSVSGVTLQKLLPEPAGLFDTTAGRYAVCCRIVYGKVRVLVAGDLTEEQQRYLVSRCREDIKADIFYHQKQLLPEFSGAVGAVRDISFDTPPQVMVTDGSSITVKEQ